MEVKGELQKVLEIAHELFAHEEKRSLRPELHKALSYHHKRPSFFTHRRAHLCPYGLPVALPFHEPSKQAGPLASLPACLPLPCLRLHWLLHGVK